MNEFTKHKIYFKIPNKNISKRLASHLPIHSHTRNNPNHRGIKVITDKDVEKYQQKIKNQNKNMKKVN